MSNNYYIYSIILNGCPYSTAGHELISSFNNINSKFVYIDSVDKDKYKTNLISTFPQIYLKKKNSNGSFLIGGYTDFKEIIDIFNNCDMDMFKINLKNFIYKNCMNKNLRWNKKILLRLIKLLNTPSLTK